MWLIWFLFSFMIIIIMQGKCDDAPPALGPSWQFSCPKRPSNIMMHGVTYVYIMYPNCSLRLTNRCNSCQKWCQMMQWRHYDVTWRNDVTPWRHVTSHHKVLWCHMMSGLDKVNLRGQTHQKLRNYIFQYGGVDLRPWPPKLPEIVQRLFTIPTFVTLGQTDQQLAHWLTDIQTQSMD